MYIKLLAIMKKHFLLLMIVPLMMISCYEGDVGEREEYIVSGYVYYPDSTPLGHAAVVVNDTQFYSQALSGVMLWDPEYGGKADENGYFEIVIPDGGKQGIHVMTYFQPTSDTAEVKYHYHGSKNKHYSGKHGFEGLQIYSYIIEHPIHYPYLIPSYPFIGDSVRVVAAYQITHIDLFEGNSSSNRHNISSVDYQEPDTSVMFLIPEGLSLETIYHLDVLGDNSGKYIRLHLREHEQ